MFETTIAGSLPKPSWLAEPNKLWPQWRASGDDLAAAKADATLLALKEQEDAGIDCVTDGEMSRQHFVHGFLEFVDGIDFAHKVEMGIRADRYKAMVPQVIGVFLQQKQVLPLPTRILIVLSDLVAQYGALLFAVAVLAAIAAWLAFRRPEVRARLGLS